MPVTSADGAGPVLSHMLERLEEPHPIGDLARRAVMSSRTFARRFVAAFYPQAEFDVTTRTSTVAGHAFKTEGKVLVKPATA